MVARRWVLAASATLAVSLVAARPAATHAFLDHASPAVGSTVATAPEAVTLWFTQKIEPAFSTVSVTDQTGQRVDLGDARVPPGQPAVLQVGLKRLPPGSYTVRWRVVSVDTHPTDGSFAFTVGGG